MKARKIERPAIKTLHADSVHTISTWVSWSELPAESYTAYGANRCEECGAVIVLQAGGGGEPHRDLEHGVSCHGYVYNFEGPAMNYYYALPGSYTADDAKKIEHLPLCLIEWADGSGRDGWALSLTGGGMDLSWEIAEAFMCLGELPPLKYAGRLPDMSGKSGAGARYVLAGARKSIQVARNWLKNDAATVKRLAASVRANDASRKAAR